MLPCDRKGVYAVAMADEPDQLRVLKAAPISIDKVKKWLDIVPRLTLDRRRPLPAEVVHRLSGFWLSDETILYIGMTGRSLMKRVNDYYGTKLGDPKPHRGGHCIKTLDNMNECHIYWCECPSPEYIEALMINKFMDQVPGNVRRKLFDPDRPFPFANLCNKRGNNKNHGIKYSNN